MSKQIKFGILITGVIFIFTIAMFLVINYFKENKTNDGLNKVNISNENDKGENMEIEKIKILVNNHELTATLNNNSSAKALVEALKKGPITIDMADYANMEKVGTLGINLPRNDENITTEAGDLILYQGNNFVIYYDKNNWSLTRLGKIDNVNAKELKSILGSGNVKVTLSLD